MATLGADLSVDVARLGSDITQQKRELVKLYDKDSSLDVLENAMDRVKALAGLPNALRPGPKSSIIVFTSYSHKDDKLREEVFSDLKRLQSDGLIEAWYDGKIDAGDEIDQEIHDKLDEAHVILLLVSRPFLNSDYITRVELPRAMQRHDEGTAHIIPIILRPSPFLDPPWSESFGRLKAIPRDGKPVVKWKNRDDAFVDVYRSVRGVILEMIATTEGGQGPNS